MTTKFYEDLYSSGGMAEMDEVLSKVPAKVAMDMNNFWNKPYTKEETKTTLFQMFPSKAPGQDGFPAHFFQKHFDICGDEVVKAVMRVISGVEDAKCINNT